MLRRKGASDCSRLLGQLELDPRLESVIVGVHNKARVLDTGTLLAACLLDPDTADLLGVWLDRTLKRAEIIRWLDGHAPDGEGPVTDWRIGASSVAMSAWAAFVLRFLPRAPQQELVLVSGLLELSCRSVVSLLDFLQVNGEHLMEKLSEHELFFDPLSTSEMHSPHRMEAERRFQVWLLPKIGEFQRVGETDPDWQVNTLLLWLAERYDELAAGEVVRHGDIGLFECEDLRDVCVLDERGVWRSMTFRLSGESLSALKLPTCVFRPPRNGNEPLLQDDFC